MKAIQRIGTAGLIVVANVVWAHGPGTHGQPAETPAAASKARATSDSMFAGKVRSVDKAEGTVTLERDAVPSLNIPKATNVFAVSNRAMLDNVKTGDAVLFAADKNGGDVTVTAIRKTK